MSLTYIIKITAEKRDIEREAAAWESETAGKQTAHTLTTSGDAV